MTALLPGAIWLGPVALLLNCLEEFAGFPEWVRRHVNPAFTRRRYVRVHALGMGVWLATALAVSLADSPAVMLLAFTFVITPGLLWNTVFHAGASVYYGARSPGVITAAVAFLPLYALLSTAAIAAGAISVGGWLLAAAVAAVFHAAEVRTNVFRGGGPVLRPEEARRG
jgi:hypothetical protein